MQIHEGSSPELVNRGKSRFLITLNRVNFLAAALSDDVAEVATAIGLGAGTVVLVGAISYAYKAWKAQKSSRQLEVSLRGVS